MSIDRSVTLPFYWPMRWVKYNALSLCLCLLRTDLVHGEITVIDYLNRSVTISRPAQRIVALAPHIVENVFSVGADNKLVGAVDYSDFPPPAKTIERVGGADSFSIEKILSLEPDVVIAWASSGKGNMIQQLTAFGIAVYIDDPRTLVDIARSIRDIGRLTGSTAQSDAVADHYLSTLQRLRHRYRDRRRRAERVSVLYEAWHRPLQTVNGEHIISDVIDLCGGDNAFADAALLAPKISIETVIGRDPDIIISSGGGSRQLNSQQFKSQQIHSQTQWRNAWLRWPNLRAVRHRHLYFIDANVIQRHSVRILTGAEMICGYIASAAATAR